MPQYLFLWCVKLCKRNFVQNSICKCFWKQVGKNKKKEIHLSPFPITFGLLGPIRAARQHPNSLSLSHWRVGPTCRLLLPPPTVPSFSHAQEAATGAPLHDDAPTPTSLGLSRLRVVADLAPLSPSSFPHSQPQPSVWTVRKTTAEALQTRRATSRWIKPPLPPFAVPVSSPTPSLSLSLPFLSGW